MWSGGALAMVCVAGGLTMTVEKTVLLQDDVADIGIRAGTLHPCPLRAMGTLQTLANDLLENRAKTRVTSRRISFK